MPGTPASTNEYLIAIGKVTHNASLNEAFMFTAFQVLSGVDSKIANSIFYTLDSLQGKKSLLNRVAAATGDEKDKRLIKEIIAATEKSNNQRREINHALAMWETSDLNTSPSAVFHPKARRASPLTKEWLSLLIRHSQEAGAEAYQAFKMLCEKHGVPPSPEL